MNEPLVSIITACYNGERFIDRWKMSLLNQTYKNIEVLVINDGSMDNSYKMLKYCQDEFIAKGYSFKCFNQQNAGIGAATNVGLQNMAGTYFMIYDIDDLLDPQCIEERVDFLEKNLDCSEVLSDGWFADETSLEKKYPMKFLSPHLVSMEHEKEYIFTGVLLGERGAATCPYMHRTSSYIEINPNRLVYPSQYLQDSQIVLLNSYRYKCGFISTKMYTIVSHKDSHSHANKAADWDNYLYLQGQEVAFLNTIRSLPAPLAEKIKYETIIKQRFFIMKNKVLADLAMNSDVLPKRIIIFGAGITGVNVSQVGKMFGVDVLCFVDNNPEKNGKILEGIEIVNFDTAREKFNKDYIVIASKRGDHEIKKQLLNQGMIENIDFCHYSTFLKICNILECIKMFSIANM